MLTSFLGKKEQGQKEIGIHKRKAPRIGLASRKARKVIDMNPRAEEIFVSGEEALCAPLQPEKVAALMVKAKELKADPALSLETRLKAGSLSRALELKARGSGFEDPVWGWDW